jgi:hypothetical protein
MTMMHTERSATGSAPQAASIIAMVTTIIVLMTT